MENLRCLKHSKHGVWSHSCSAHDAHSHQIVVHREHRDLTVNGPEKEFPTFLRIPNLFQFDHDSCLLINSDRGPCIQMCTCEIDSRRITMYTPICNRCALNMMKMVSTLSSSQSSNISADGFQLTSKTICCFIQIANPVLVIKLHPIYVHYHLQSKQHLARYLMTMIYLCKDSVCKQYLQELDMLDTYQQALCCMITYISLRPRWVLWFIEMDEGRVLKDIFIDAFENHLKPSKWNTTEQAPMWTGWVGPIATHIGRFRRKYLLKSKRKQLRTSARVRKNYQWIQKMCQIPVERHLEFQQRAQEHSKLRVDLKRRIKKCVRCDNRECPNSMFAHYFASPGLIVASDIHYRRCGRCKMMNYCSRRCQKVDWNKYDHKRMCFEYGGKASSQEHSVQMNIIQIWLQREEMLALAHNIDSYCPLCPI